jgi:hypothetical protein
VGLSELVGHVDERERPLIRVPIPDQDRSFLALVDTGFNGWLLMDAVRLGFVANSPFPSSSPDGATVISESLTVTLCGSGDATVSRCW